MRKIGLSQRVQYRFDELMSKGPVALIAALFAASFLVILGVAVVVYVSTTEGRELGVGALMWMGLMRVLDSGTMGGDTGSPLFLLGMFGVTLGGIFVVGSLIGILTTGLDSRLDEMRKGRSLVIEQDHTIIIGWSSTVFNIISELVIANANQPSSCIAILADLDKVEMEEQIRQRVPSTGKTKIVCRSGSPIDPAALEIMNPNASRSIIILAGDDEDADIRTIKSILALTNSPHRRPEPYLIVTELRDERNLEAARLVGRDEVEFIKVDELVARMMAQTCRQSGLSVVYTELLDFGGDEIYFQAEPALIGKTFGETLLAYEDSAVIGVQTQAGAIRLNPPMESLLQSGDRLIVISADDDTIRLSWKTELGIDASAMRHDPPCPQVPESTLILGWNRHAPALIQELDNYVAPGSRITVVAWSEDHHMQEHLVQELQMCCKGLSNQSIEPINASTTSRQSLDALDVPSYSHIITLSYSDLMDEQKADAHTLVTLLHLRDIAQASHRSFSLVSEMLDSRNRDLAEVTQADDFIVSHKLVSLLMTQISENRSLAAVFQDLFNPQGSELYLKPVGEYVNTGQPVNFYTLVESARQRGQVAIGYRLRRLRENASKNYGVRLNPPKSELVTFEDGDRIIVLSEE